MAQLTEGWEKRMLCRRRVGRMVLDNTRDDENGCILERVREIWREGCGQPALETFRIPGSGETGVQLRIPGFEDDDLALL